MHILIGWVIFLEAVIVLHDNLGFSRYSHDFHDIFMFFTMWPWFPRCFYGFHDISMISAIFARFSSIFSWFLQCFHASLDIFMISNTNFYYLVYIYKWYYYCLGLFGAVRLVVFIFYLFIYLFLIYLFIYLFYIYSLNYLYIIYLCVRVCVYFCATDSWLG